MFSSFFRAMRQNERPEQYEVPEEYEVPEQHEVPDTPTPREILEHSKRCIDVYKNIFNVNNQILAQNKELINTNKRIMSEMRETTRLLTNSLPRPQQITTCPENHNLTVYTARGGHCDVCNRIVFVGEQVMDCRECNWYMCARCSRNNGFTMPSATRRARTEPQPSFQTIFNDLLNPPVTAAQSELYTFDIPLNGQGFDAFITQLTQTLNELAPLSQEDVVVTPTDAQINKACLVMPASEANLSTLYVCPIDLSPIEDYESVMKIKHCGHVFRESNLRELFTRDVRCPLCRFDIRDHVEVTAARQNEGDSEDDI